MHEPVPALYFLYIVPPLGAFKSQGGHSISLLFYIAIDSCDYIYIYIYI